MAFSADGKVLASGGGDRAIRRWQTATLRPLAPLGGFERGVYSVAFSADGRTLAAVGYDKALYLWHTATGRACEGFAGSGLASGSADGTVLIWSLGWVITGAKRRRSQIGRRELEAAWSDLASMDAAAGHRAIGLLVNAGDKAVVFLRARLRPVNLDRQRLRRLIAELDSNRYGVRRQAAAGIDQLGRLAEADLREQLDGGPSLEVRRRVEQILETKRTARPSPESLRALRALEVLEHLGTRDTRQLTEQLARGTPGAPLTRYARAALKRLAGRPVGMD